jgi:hypothetical protein
MEWNITIFQMLVFFGILESLCSRKCSTVRFKWENGVVQKNSNGKSQNKSWSSGTEFCKLSVGDKWNRE